MPNIRDLSPHASLKATRRAASEGLGRRGAATGSRRHRRTPATAKRRETQMTTRFADTLRAMTVALPFALGAMSLGSASAPAATAATIFMPINAKFSSRPELPWRMSRWVLSLARRLFSFTVSPTVFTHGPTPGLCYRKPIPSGAYWRSICVVTVPAVCLRPPSARQRRKSAFASPTTPPTLLPSCGRWASSGPASLVIR